MRNKWLPKRLARYIIGEELKRLHERGARIQRDSQWGVVKKEEPIAAAQEAVDNAIGKAWVEEAEARAHGTVPATEALRVEIEHVEVSLKRKSLCMLGRRLILHSRNAPSNSSMLYCHPSSSSSVQYEDRTPQKTMRM
jgi:hypothetical protein